MKKKIIALLFLSLLTFPILTFAQTAAPASTSPCSLDQVRGLTGDAKTAALPRCVNQIYIWSLGVAALLAFLMIVVGGYTYMTAAGNAERTSTGTEMIWGAVIGLVLLFGAYLLLNTINPDLVNFNLDSLKGTDSNTFNQTPGQTTTAPHN